MKGFVRRWQGIVEHQIDYYEFQNGKAIKSGSSLDEYVSIDRNALYFDPRKFSLARGSPIAALLFTGTILSVLRNFHLRSFCCRQVISPTSTTALIRDGRFVSTHVAANAPWIVTWEGDINNQHSAAYLRCQNASIFEGFVRGPPTRILRKVADVLCREEGVQTRFNTLAKALNLSERTLNRRLSESGVSYKTLVRVKRFQRACLSISQGASNIDDIAFESHYSDRQHMSREFRFLGGVSPAYFRELSELG